MIFLSANLNCDPGDAEARFFRAPTILLTLECSGKVYTKALPRDQNSVLLIKGLTSPSTPNFDPLNHETADP